MSKDRPVIILDQSGHLGYVNQKAFDVVCGVQNANANNCTIPDSVKSGGGDWVTDSAKNFVGLLQEPSAFGPFLTALQKNLPVAQVFSDPVKFAETGARTSSASSAGCATRASPPSRTAASNRWRRSTR